MTDLRLINLGATTLGVCNSEGSMCIFVKTAYWTAVPVFRDIPSQNTVLYAVFVVLKFVPLTVQVLVARSSNLMHPHNTMVSVYLWYHPQIVRGPERCNAPVINTDPLVGTATLP